MSDAYGGNYGISLRELLPEAVFYGAADVRVRSCSADSRNCQPGDLFAALSGVRVDGHDFAPQAIGRGAVAILAERLLPVDVPMCVVPNARDAFGRICQALAGHPSRSLKVIGITGTNGKTTTSCLIASILNHAGCTAGLLGTLGYCDSLEVAPAALTTPAAPQLATWLARMVAAGCSHAVMEVSSHSLSQSRVAGVEFDVACVTNVRHDHLDYHLSPANYRNAKGRLFDHLSPEGLVVLNADDAAATEYLARLDCPVLTIGTKGIGEITASLVERFPSEQTILLSAGNETVPIRTTMIGDHHIYNCLMAAAVGLAYGIDLPTVVRGLEAVDRVPGRLERIECGQPFSVFIDYAHTPDALAASLDTLREVTRGKLICVFGAGGNRDRQKRPLMGRAAEALADAVILTADNPRHEAQPQITADILAGCEQPERIDVVPDRADAIARAIAMAAPGDTVVVAGKGHETHQIVGGRRFPFDDRQFARECLYNLQPDPTSTFSRGSWPALN